MTIPFHNIQRTNRRPRSGTRPDTRKAVFWTIDRIREGVRRFQHEHQRIPSASDFDRVDYLPTSRHIHMYFGGVPHLRELLGVGKVHLGKGKHRGAIATLIGKRGYEAEKRMSALLEEMFGSMFVHSEKKFDREGGKTTRVDFFVYNRTQPFAVDVTVVSDSTSLSVGVRLKITKYRLLPFPVYIVIMNDGLSSKYIRETLHSERMNLPQNIFIEGLGDFLDIIKIHHRYHVGENS